MFSRNKLLTLIVFFMVFSGVLVGAVAAEWPQGVIKIVCPFPAAGPTDMVARLIAEDLSRTLGQQVIVDNRPGANAQIGTDLVAKASPDGQTLLLTASPFAILAALDPRLPYDAVRDFEPVILIGTDALVLVANPSAPAKTMQELLAQARAKPGSLLIATVGTTSMTSMATELLARIGRVEVTTVPYKGTGQALPDVLGGQVPYFFDNLSTSLAHIKAGRLRALAYTALARSRALPGVPTMAESGLEGFEAANWFGLFAPAKTPARVLDRLNQDLARFVRRPDVVERLDTMEVVGNSRAEFAAFVRAEIDKWAKVAKEKGIQPK